MKEVAKLQIKDRTELFQATAILLCEPGFGFRVLRRGEIEYR